MSEAAQNEPAPYDLLIVGGGINGSGIARDAAGRGLSVVLCEKDDLAAHTSSASTKLIHGGLRYLEQYAFRLVRESLKEREVLLRAAPHIIRPLRFILPHHRGLRPAWLLRLGLFLYDHMGGRELLAPTRRVALHSGPLAGLLKPEFRLGFEYSDCWVEDARLVALNAADAAARGASIHTRTKVTALERDGAQWRATLEGKDDGLPTHLRARAVVNAAGPWAGAIAGAVGGDAAPPPVRLVKGSHIVVPRLHDDPRAFIFQNTDGRIVFAIPYEGAYTLIGTTDRPVETPEEDTKISEDEIAYLRDLANGYFARAVAREDVVWSYSGVRVLYGDENASASKATRDYRLEMTADSPPALSVYGGKLTTYRKLAEHALEKLGPSLPPMGAPWTGSAPLPGGDIPGADFEAYFERLTARYPEMPEDLLRRLARAYGTKTPDLLGEARGLGDLGEAFGAGLTEREVRYLIDHEFARSGEDILWRRSKLGLHMTADERAALEAWLARRDPAA